jgi:hypothetical protein
MRRVLVPIEILLFLIATNLYLVGPRVFGGQVFRNYCLTNSANDVKKSQEESEIYTIFYVNDGHEKLLNSVRFERSLLPEKNLFSIFDRQLTFLWFLKNYFKHFINVTSE